MKRDRGIRSDGAIRVHRELGPGLLESVYEAVLAKALIDRGLRVARQVPIGIDFDGVRLDEGFRVDLVVDGKVIVELKSVETIHDAHTTGSTNGFTFAGRCIPPGHRRASLQ
jgi:GxxExxY protein